MRAAALAFLLVLPVAVTAQVRRRAGPESRVLLPAMPGLVDPATVTLADADYVWLFP